MERKFSLLLLVLIPIAGGIVSGFIGTAGKKSGCRKEKWREALVMAVLLVELLCTGLMTTGFGIIVPQEFKWSQGYGLGIHLVFSPARLIYSTIAAFMWFVAGGCSGEYFGKDPKRKRYDVFYLMTLGAVIGVLLSGDLYTAFLFFEMLSFTSYVWVVHDGRKASLQAAETYLAVAVTGGLVLLMGLFLLYDMAGTLEIAELGSACLPFKRSARLYTAGGCLLFGFGAKAGAFPLHIWLPKAHPVAPAPASALLSGMLTKSGIYGIIVVTVLFFLEDTKWGSLLLWIGAVTMLLGAVLAVFSINLKRTLACSSVSQIGFILVGIGMLSLPGGREGMAFGGTFLHMINHSLLKLVLFLAAGVIYQNIHRLELDDIRGFGRKKPLLHFIFLMGFFGIGGIPFWNGYVSKTMLHEAIVEYMAVSGNMWISVLEWVFLYSGGLTAAYMMKLYVAVFVEKNADSEIQKKYDEMHGYIGKIPAVLLAFSAVLLSLIGVAPLFTESGRELYSFHALQGGLISIGIGAAVYLFIIRMLLMGGENEKRNYINLWPQKLDLEMLVYRPLMLKILPCIGGVAARIGDDAVDSIIVLLRKTVYRDSKIPHELEEGTQVTHTLGSLMDNMELTFFHKKTSYEHKLAMKHEDFVENSTIIGRSLSFGLFMACMGLILTLVYLLL